MKLPMIMIIVHLLHPGGPLDVEPLPSAGDDALARLPHLAHPAGHCGAHNLTIKIMSFPYFFILLVPHLIVEKQQPPGLGATHLAQAVELQLLDVVLPEQDSLGLALGQLGPAVPQFGVEGR